MSRSHLSTKRSYRDTIELFEFEPAANDPVYEPQEPEVERKLPLKSLAWAAPANMGYPICPDCRWVAEASRLVPAGDCCPFVDGHYSLRHWPGGNSDRANGDWCIEPAIVFAADSSV